MEMGPERGGNVVERKAEIGQKWGGNGVEVGRKWGRNGGGKQAEMGWKWGKKRSRGAKRKRGCGAAAVGQR